MMRKKILVVDDDKDTGMVIRKVLERACYDVEVLEHGRNLVEGRFDRPDLFILDHQLPAIEGIALCKFLRLKPDTKDIPIILISGHNHLEGRSGLAGADYFLAKPLTSSRLLEVVDHCLSTGTNAPA